MLQPGIGEPRESQDGIPGALLRSRFRHSAGRVLSPMLANFYLHEFDRRMLARGFNLVRYADDFVVMCDTEEKARQAHAFSRVALQTLNLHIHALDVAGSKSKIGYFPKDGLLFLGIRFEGQQVFPASKAINRFESKVQEILDAKSGDSLFKTLQRLTNLSMAGANVIEPCGWLTSIRDRMNSLKGPSSAI